ncbi:hypothetical protein EDB84DRAFT_1600572 [Lactarius hengduanensis]|nr:hypothetical protein EDB84DRAFT_1600572 [Lactarius hengduanensis]
MPLILGLPSSSRRGAYTPLWCRCQCTDFPAVCASSLRCQRYWRADCSLSVCCQHTGCLPARFLFACGPAQLALPDLAATSFLPTKPRYQSIAPASILPPDSLIALPHNSQHYAQSQGFGAHLDEYPKEPPNTAMTYNTSVQLRTQSFTSSAYELAMPHFPSLMNPAFNRYSNSAGAPPSVQIAPSTSHFNLSHPSSSTASAPIPQPPLASPLVLDTVDPPKSVAPHGLPDASGAPSSRPGPTRNVPSGVIACRQCAKIVSSGVTIALTTKSLSDGGQINVLARANAPARNVNRTDLSQRNNGDEISPTTLPVFVPVHQKVNKPETDPPAQASSFVVGTLSFPGLLCKETPSYDDPSPPPADDPVVNYARNSWWDELLDAYAPTREQAFEDVSNDLKVLSTSSGHWLTFFNVDWFLPNLMDTRIRAHMQPALVYAYLAMAKFVRSSEIELGVCGRLQALKLRDVAKTHLQESWNKQWIDLGLAEAAMVLALFETSAHPQHNDASADAAWFLTLKSGLEAILDAQKSAESRAPDPEAARSQAE